MNKEQGITYEVIDHLGTISQKNNYSKEVNFLSWAGREPVYDIRGFRTDANGVRHPLKGISMSKADLIALRGLLQNIDLGV